MVVQNGGRKCLNNVAEMIGKEHRHLLRDIREYAKVIQNAAELNFGLGDKP